jgi:5,10-methylenetetrahydromethanopterin reductase
MALATRYLGPLLKITRAAEDAGFDRVWTTEGFGGDGIVRAGHLLANTSRIGIATGIAYTFARAPLTVAMAAADLAEISDGRFALGLGAGTRGIRAQRFDVADYDHPAPRTAEYVELVRAALHSETGLQFDGKYYHCNFPQLELPQDLALRMGVEIYGAALNPAMLRAAARSCDGVALHSLATSPAYLRDVVGPAVAGSTAKLAAWKICVVDDDAQRADESARRQLAFYFSTPSYKSVLAGTPWEDTAIEIQQAAREQQYRNWDPVVPLIPADMVREFSIAGDKAACTEQIAAVVDRFASAGIDELVLQLTTGDTPESTVRNGLALVSAAAPISAAPRTAGVASNAFV